MKRTPFRRKAPPPRPAKQISAEYTLRPRAAAVAVAGPARAVVQVPKQEPVRDESYRRRVAALDCIHCGAVGLSQAAHSDSAGKGMALKSCDLTCYPLCGTTPGDPGCHWLIGTSGRFTREERRALERKYADETMAMLKGRNEAN